VQAARRRSTSSSFRRRTTCAGIRSANSWHWASRSKSWPSRPRTPRPRCWRRRSTAPSGCFWRTTSRRRARWVRSTIAGATFTWRCTGRERSPSRAGGEVRQAQQAALGQRDQDRSRVAGRSGQAGGPRRLLPLRRRQDVQGHAPERHAQRRDRLLRVNSRAGAGFSPRCECPADRRPRPALRQSRRGCTACFGTRCARRAASCRGQCEITKRDPRR